MVILRIKIGTGKIANTAAKRHKNIPIKKLRIVVDVSIRAMYESFPNAGKLTNTLHLTTFVGCF